MSLLPTTRISSSVVGGSGNGADVNMPGIQDDDILLVDFQPVVVPSSQILSSPSTTTSTAMYPLPPPLGPGTHMVGVNHHPSVSSDGVTTPISATGSSGKANSNPNNFSLVSLSNHVHHHNNNTSREESDFTYPNTNTQQFHLPHHHHPNTATVTIPLADDDEDDEFARHQALAQPGFANKRRYRRFAGRDNHHLFDNANHRTFPHQPQMSSSLSSEDSDTGFLVGTRRTAYTKRSVQKVVDPLPLNPVGGNGSPSATTGLLPNLGGKKRVRRRRPSTRNRKPLQSQRDKMPDVLSFCCLCQEDPQQRTHRVSTSSIKTRYLRLTCIIVAILVVILFSSVILSLEKKIDSLELNLRKLDQSVGSPLSVESPNGKNSKPMKTLETLISDHTALNATVVNFKAQLDQVVSKLQDLQAKFNAAASKSDDSVAEVKGTLGTLGSRVEELSVIIKGVQSSIEKLRTQDKTSSNNPPSSSSGNEKPSEAQSTSPT